MHRLVGIVVAGALLLPGAAQAQVQPHRAEYALRLGAAANAPRIGTAVHDLSQDCGGWHLKRDIRTEIALTTSWRMTLSSKLDGQEPRSGNGFRFSTVQVQNGSERELKGRVQRQGGELKAEIAQAGGPPNQFVLPPPTLMPVAAIGHLIDRLQAKAASFQALMFDAEVMGDAFLVEVTEQERSQLRGARPVDKPVAVSSAKSWPVFMTFARGRQQDQRPLFTVGALVFDNGVLDRLTVETGLVTVTADLQALEMRPVPNCPRSGKTNHPILPSRRISRHRMTSGGFEMKIAVIGAGVSGLGAAWMLSRRHDVVVYEREARFGGHACTIDAATPAGRQPVDVGFIVFNELNYPNLVALFEHLGVPTEPSNMSFAVSLDEGRFEYASSSAGYLAQRGNIVRPAFLRMTHDIVRFNRLAPRLLERCEDLDFTIGDFIDDARLGAAFRDRYLMPMAACIWSTPLGRMLDYPAQTFVRFFHNHGLLTVGPQLAWRTVSGGSRSYVERIVAPLRQRARLATPAAAVRRGADGVHVRDARGQWDRFDKLIMACHADQALALLTDADQRERDLLGRFAYSSNEVWLHADASLMPRRRSVWSSWNYVADSAGRDSPVSVTYWMNRLQNLSDRGPLFVSVNPGRPPAGAATHARFTFEHPMYDAHAIRAQREVHALQGVRDTFFCGSYCGYGFHEDALSAGLDVAEQLGVRRPWLRPDEHRRIGDPPRVVTDRPPLQPIPLPATARVATS